MDGQKKLRSAKLNLICFAIICLFLGITLLLTTGSLDIVFIWLCPVFVFFMEYMKVRCQVAFAEGRSVNKKRYIRILFIGCVLLTVMIIAGIPLTFIFSRLFIEYLWVVVSPIMVGAIWLGYVRYRSDIMSATINQEDSIEINT